MGSRDLIRENAWVFDQQPTAEQIEELLKEVPAWHGSTRTMADYMGFVVSISGKLGKEQNYRVVWRLYTTVAGKIAILHDAHVDENGKQIPITEDVEVKRDGTMFVVSGTMTSPIYGVRFEVGTGATGEDAKGADKTNPVENAMTSWRGRAASAMCGAGVLPYTGIASAEEVTSAQHRDEMYRVVTPDTPKAETPRNNPAATAITSIKKNQKWDDDKLEEVLSEYLQSVGTVYEGTATDYVLAGGKVDPIGEMMKWYKSK